MEGKNNVDGVRNVGLSGSESQTPYLFSMMGLGRRRSANRCPIPRPIDVKHTRVGFKQKRGEGIHHTVAISTRILMNYSVSVTPWSDPPLLHASSISLVLRRIGCGTTVIVSTLWLR